MKNFNKCKYYLKNINEFLYDLYDNKLFNDFILKVKDTLIAKIVRFYYSYEDLIDDNFYSEVYYLKSKKYYKAIGWINYIRKNIKESTNYDACLDIYKNFYKNIQECYVYYNKDLLNFYQQNGKKEGDVFLWIDLKKAYDVILYLLGGFESFESFKKFIKLDKLSRKFIVGASLRDYGAGWDVWVYGKLVRDDNLAKTKFYGLKAYWYLVGYLCKNIMFLSLSDLLNKYDFKVKIDVLLFWVDCIFLVITGEGLNETLNNIVADYKNFLKLNFFNYFDFLKNKNYYFNFIFFDNRIIDYIDVHCGLYEFNDYFNQRLILNKQIDGKFLEKIYYLQKEILL